MRVLSAGPGCVGPGVKRTLPFLSWINAEVNAYAWDCSHPANLAHFLSSVLECASPIHPHSLNPSPPLVFNQTLPFLRSSLCLPYFKRHPISAVLCLPVLRYFIFIALFFTHRIIELLICLLYVSSLRR